MVLITSEWVVRNILALIRVSVPLRGLWFLSYALWSRIRALVTRFRPLAGIMVLIQASQRLNIMAAMLVSVPLRGLWFLSVNRFKFIKRECEKGFPSPCGDYGSYPFLKMLLLPFSHSLVSVPLRGLWFLSHYDFRSPYATQLGEGFRPLAGIMVLIRMAEIRKRCRNKGVSVPLRGLWFLSSVCLQGQTIIASKAVSVPLRGLWFLSCVGLITSSDGTVSVPLRGLWFLSCMVCNQSIKE